MRTLDAHRQGDPRTGSQLGAARYAPALVAVVFALCLLVPPLAAETVRVVIEVELDRTESTQLPSCLVQLHAEVAIGAAPEPIEAACSLASSEGLFVSTDQTYRVHVEERGAWYPEARLDPSVSTRIALPGYATVEHVIRLEAARGETLEPESARVDAEVVGHRGALLTGPVSCEAEQERLRCGLPSTPASYRYELPGHMPAYVVDAEPAELPSMLVLTPGGSISAWVPVPSSETAEDLRAALFPDLPGRTSWLGARHRRSGDPTDPPNSVGPSEALLQVGPLEPGEYTVYLASTGGARADVERLRVAEGKETRAGRIDLEGPFRVEVSVAPPEAPGKGSLGAGLETPLEALDRNPWPRYSQEIGLENGHGTFVEVPAGTYRLLISDDSGVYFDENRTIGRSSTRFDVGLDLVELTGKVTCGGEPVTGAVVFDSTVSGRIVEVEADQDGAFRGWIPRGGSPWRIGLRQDGPWTQQMQPVEIEDSGAFATVDLALPGTSMTVRVEDLSGAPEDEAFVSVRARSESPSGWSAATDERGIARARCVEYGSYRVRANSAEGRSDPQLVEVEDDRPVDVTLRIEREIPVRGRVLLEGGAIDDVEVLVQQVVEGEAIGGWRRARSRNDGTVEFTERPGPADLVISRPGLPFHLRRITVAEGAPDLEISMASVGGDVRFDPPLDRADSRSLRSQGAEVPLALLLQSRERGLRSDPASLPGDLALTMEPGLYQVCPEVGADPGRCLGFQVVAGQDGVVSTYLLDAP